MKFSSIFSAVCAFIIFFLSVQLTGCTERGPIIDLGENRILSDTTYVSDTVEEPQEKNVLIDEFTGVRCVNCPDGHALVKNLQNNHPGRVVALSWHSNLLGEPFPHSSQDLKIPEAQQMEGQLGGLQGKPSAAIDRKLYSGENQRLLLMPRWAGYVNERLQEISPVNMSIETSYDSEEGILTAQTILHYTKAVQFSNRLSVVLIEDEIVEPQVTPNGVKDDYVHQHAVRAVLTALNGVNIEVEKVPGRIVKTTFESPIESHWDIENMYVVAIVHLPTPEQTAIHAVQKSVLD